MTGTVVDSGGHKPPDPVNEVQSRLPVHMRTANNDGICRWFLLRRSPSSKDQSLPDPFAVAAQVEKQLQMGSLRNRISVCAEAEGNRYAIQTMSPAIASALLSLKQLDINTNIEVIEHPSMNRIQGKIYCPEVKSMPKEKLLSELASQNVVDVFPLSTFNQKTKTREFRGNLALTFSLSTRPNFVYIGWLRIECEAYYPSPLICRRCCSYGHGHNTCREKFALSRPVKCTRCTGAHENTQLSPCTQEFKCAHCPEPNETDRNTMEPPSNAHSCCSRHCPKYREEEVLIKYKVDNNLTWRQARNAIKRNTPNMNDDNVLRRMQIQETEIDELRNTMRALQQKLDSTLKAKEKAENERERMREYILKAERRIQSQNQQIQQLQEHQKLQQEQKPQSQQQTQKALPNPKKIARKERQQQMNPNSTTSLPTDRSGPITRSLSKDPSSSLQSTTAHQHIDLSDDNTDIESQGTKRGRISPTRQDTLRKHKEVYKIIRDISPINNQSPVPMNLSDTESESTPGKYFGDKAE